MANIHRKNLIYTLILGALCSNAHAQVVLDGSTGSSGNIDASNNVYEITSNLGRTEGSNLFHSFTEFSVEQQHTAHFSHTGPQNISNVISRVTGNNPSEIYGTIKSSIPGADFYLLNPNGVMFGENALLDIKGSFYATTANYIDFSDGYRMDTTVNPNMTFTSATPSDFGFTTTTPGTIEFSGRTTSDSEGETSFIGGDISLDNATLSASDGVINIASVASPGEVTTSLDMNGFTELGNITLTNGANIDVSGDSGGRIVIRSGSLTLDQSSIQSNTEGAGADSDQKVIDINTSASVTLNNQSSIASNVLPDAENNGADISMHTALLQMDEHSSISSSTEGSADGGNITLDTNKIEINNGSRITVSSESDADTGNIVVNNSGDIIITGPENSDDAFGDDYTGVSSHKDSNTPSLGGNIIVNNVGNLTLNRRSAIQSENKNAADGGDIDIQSGTMNILQGSKIGAYTVASRNISEGDTGNIDITANTLNVIGFFDAIHNSGIYVEGPHSRRTAKGDTGDIEIRGDSINILEGGRIRSKSQQSTGAQGSIVITARDISVSGLNTEEKNMFIEQDWSIEDALAAASSRIIATANFKKPFGIVAASPSSLGNLSINVENLLLNSKAYISTQTQGITNSYDINITAKNVNLDRGAYITSSASTGNGDAGNISIIADTIDIDGSGSQARLTGIYSKTNDRVTETNGGNINILTNLLKLRNNAIMTAETILDGNSGNINVDAKKILHLSNKATITSKAAENSTGNAGNINIKTALLAMDSSEISTSAITGHGGDINIFSKTLLISPDSVINAASEQSVDGSINITNTTNVVSDLVQLTAETTDVTSQFNNDCYKEAVSSSRFIANNNLIPSGSVAHISSDYSYTAINTNLTDNSRKTTRSKTNRSFVTKTVNSPLTEIAWVLTTGECQ